MRQRTYVDDNLRVISEHIIGDSALDTLDALDIHLLQI
jgi:hypothetical protein